MDRCARLFAEKGIDPDEFIVTLLEQEGQQNPGFFHNLTGAINKGVDFVKGLFADKYQKALKSLKNLEQFLNSSKDAASIASVTDNSKTVKDWVSMITKQLEGEKGLAELMGRNTQGNQGGNQSSNNQNSGETSQNHQTDVSANATDANAQGHQTSVSANASSQGTTQQTVAPNNQQTFSADTGTWSSNAGASQQNTSQQSAAQNANPRPNNQQDVALQKLKQKQAASTSENRNWFTT